MQWCTNSCMAHSFFFKPSESRFSHVIEVLYCIVLCIDVSVVIFYIIQRIGKKAIISNICLSLPQYRVQTVAVQSSEISIYILLRIIITHSLVKGKPSQKSPLKNPKKCPKKVQNKAPLQDWKPPPLYGQVHRLLPKEIK